MNHKKPTETQVREHLQDIDNAMRLFRSMGQEIAALKNQVQTQQEELELFHKGELDITPATCDRIRSLFIFRNSSTGKGLTDSQIIERVFDIKRSRSEAYKVAKELVEEIRRQYEDDRPQRLKEAKKRLRRQAS